MTLRVGSSVGGDLCSRPLTRPWRGAALLLASLAIGACSGLIGDGGGGDGKKAGGTGGAGGSGTGGAGGSGGVLPNGIAWSTRYPRLSHAQWENTTRDLLRLDTTSGLSSTFAPDAVTRFDTATGDRKVSSALFLDYQGAGEQLAALVTHDAAKLAKILPANLPTTEPMRSKAFVAAFGKRAFRRPLTTDETNAYAALFQQGVTLLGGDPVASGAEMVIRAMLQSPNFIYRIESSIIADRDVIWLSSYEMATRLSYSILNTMPSDDLFLAADAHELENAAGVAEWATRLSEQPLADVTVRGFHEQLLRVANFGTVAKDPTRFPGFSALGPVLRDEARLFLDQVLIKQGSSIADVLTSPFTFVNDQTAPYYGLAPKYGMTLTRVDLDPKQRAGILSQLGFLATAGGLTQSDPIHRGVLVNFNLLCNEVHPPPDMVPPLPAEMPGVTNRQRIENHTSACGAGCHNTIINPVGFAFEHYDAIGAWRDVDNAQPVDAKATFTLDGKMVTYDGAVEFAQLLAQSRQLYDCYARNWLEYVLGRPAVASVEGEWIRRLADRAASGSPARTLVVDATALTPFRGRPVAEEGTP